MKWKVVLRVVVAMALLLLLVLMAMNNPQRVQLSLEPLLGKPLRAPAALMYFGFFAAGVVTATVVRVGGKSGVSSKSKSSK